ncbi:DUF3053 domain-containing protein [Desulfovibrio sp. OttesenSCG-928-O18]|nr:DUF3053 domain-containing protein [Desulfovibrio sp. OttesenSCG-928-O18]
MMGTRSYRSFLGAVAAALLLAVTLFVLTGCGDNEPEQRKAFIAFLNENVLGKKGVSIPELTREQEKKLGVYTEHYALLTGFQRAMRDNARDADLLSQGTGPADLAAFAEKRSSLGKAVREARNLGKKTLELRKKTDKAKSRLTSHAELTPVYDAAYTKIVARPARLFAAMATASHESLAASLALLDFARSHSRDMKIENGQYVIYNTAVEPDFRALEAIEREKAREQEKAYAAFAKAMTE